MTKEEIYIHRINFFNDIIHILKRDLGELDKIFKQEKYMVQLKDEDFFTDPVYGELMCKIKHQFFGENFELLYSIWQVGDILKIGFLVSDEKLYNAFASNQITNMDIWNGEGNLTINERQGIFYDWSFKTKDLYGSYLNQEKYIMGVRHMHISLLKIIYNYLEQKHNLDKLF